MRTKVRATTNDSTTTGGRHSKELRIVAIPVETLKINAKNCRRHSESQIAKLAECIAQFGFNSPILIDRGLNVFAGHARLRAARFLGMTEVPTICLDHLSESQSKAFAIADNRLSELSQWDDRMLGQQLKALSVLNLDFSLETTGFETGEIDLLIEDVTSPGHEGLHDPDDLVADKSSTSLAVSQLGDLWELGEHRILCGNSLDEPSYHALLKVAKPQWYWRIRRTTCGSRET